MSPPAPAQDHVLGAVERDALAATLLSTDPAALTLCSGWDVRALTVHLVLFERHPDAWFGVPLGDRVGALERYFRRLVDRESARPWPALVERLRSGPALGPLSIDRIRSRMFLREYVVHHEDVRRAQGAGPRDGLEELQDVVWHKLPRFARLLQTPDSTGLVLRRRDGRIHVVREGADQVTIVGEPIEILLAAFGRGAVAQIDVQGAAEALTIKDTSGLVALPRVSALSMTSE
jgi:uncharacterized protein (TIGR03085 family)